MLSADCFAVAIVFRTEVVCECRRTVVVADAVVIFRDFPKGEGVSMLTDMTPTAGQLYGSQIPAMTMNVKSAVSLYRVFLYHLNFHG